VVVFFGERVLGEADVPNDVGDVGVGSRGAAYFEVAEALE